LFDDDGDDTLVFGSNDVEYIVFQHDPELLWGTIQTMLA
jgi:hypothetical protein